MIFWSSRALMRSKERLAAVMAANDTVAQAVEQTIVLLAMQAEAY
jgi:hypothetical protein